MKIRKKLLLSDSSSFFKFGYQIPVYYDKVSGCFALQKANTGKKTKPNNIKPTVNAYINVPKTF